MLNISFKKDVKILHELINDTITKIKLNKFEKIKSTIDILYELELAKQEFESILNSYENRIMKLIPTYFYNKYIFSHGYFYNEHMTLSLCACRSNIIGLSKKLSKGKGDLYHEKISNQLYFILTEIIERSIYIESSFVYDNKELDKDDYPEINDWSSLYYIMEY